MSLRKQNIMKFHRNFVSSQNEEPLLGEGGGLPIGHRNNEQKKDSQRQMLTLPTVSLPHECRILRSIKK
jgi:hypothetical protein